MKKLFPIIFIFFTTINLFSQSNSDNNASKNVYPALMDKEFEQSSKIYFLETNDSLIQSLACLGKIWGFLKYNHPQIAKGTHNWDFELFRFLPAFLSTKDVVSRENSILKWINELGDILKFSKVKHKSTNLSPIQNLGWVKTMIVDKSLKEKIYQIYERRNQGEHFYIGSNPEAPTFLNENPYANMPFPDEGFRLLSLYKYWSMIQYYYPYKHLTDKNWDTILLEYIPYFMGAKNELEYELVVLKIIGELHDTHANLWNGANEINRIRGEYYPSFHVRFVDNSLIVDDYFDIDKIKLDDISIGDIITHINGKQVKEIIDSLKIYYPASNTSARLRDISFDILRSIKNELSIEYTSSEITKKTKLTLYKKKELNSYYGWFKIKNESGIKLLANDVLYLNLAFINENEYPLVKEHLKKAKGVIVDVRNYPNFLLYSLTPYFQSGKTPFARFTHRNINNPGEFIWSKNLSIDGIRKPFSKKLIILANEVTQSLGEFTVMALKATGNAKVLGSQTAGADGRIADIFLPGGLKTTISGYGVYYPNKKETQRTGIVPDIEVKPTIKGIKEGRDELMEKAIEIINE